MANAQEHELHYPLGDRLPALGEALAVAPGLRWLRMGLPFALDHINLWLLRDRDEQGREGWAIVDCGIDNPATRAAWEQVFATGLDGLPVLRVIVTHMHPDHIGLAHWLCARWQCRLWISATDWHTARGAIQRETGFGGDAAARFYRRHGLVDEGALAQLRQRGNHFASLVPELPAQYRRLMDGMPLRIADGTWRCIVGYGHAPEHIALFHAEADVLISGDMVLPRISTNVSVIDIEPEADPLPLYLDSVARLRSLPAATLVLPSHGKLHRAACAHRSAARPPCHSFRGHRASLLPSAPVCSRFAARAVPPPAGSAPDHLRDGRSRGAPARLARAGALAAGGRRRWRAALRPGRLMAEGPKKKAGQREPTGLFVCFVLTRSSLDLLGFAHDMHDDSNYHDGALQPSG
jgi:glyoxylase-like metal-dependent hydrolase (beta-lactamase superfamily II)